MYNKTAKDRVHSFNTYVFRDFFNLDGPFLFFVGGEGESFLCISFDPHNYPVQ